MPKLNIPRDVLAKMVQGNPLAIRQLEQVFSDVGSLPTTIEEAHALAGDALQVAQAALAMLALVSDALALLEGAPAPWPQIDPDDTAPRAHLGTISSQNADAVAVTGGAIDATPIGVTTAAEAKFTTIAASGQVTSTLPDGTPPLVVQSRTKVVNLNCDLLLGRDWGSPGKIGNFTPDDGTFNSLNAVYGFGCNGKSPQGSVALGAAATDLATAIALVNNIRSALIANGIGS